MRHLLIFMLTIASIEGKGQFFNNIGIRAGATYSKIKWEQETTGNAPAYTNETSNTFGYNIEITSDIFSKKRWGINSSLGLIRMRGKHTYPYSYNINNSYGTTLIKETYELDYISFSNVAVGKLNISDSFYFFGKLGPSLSYLYHYSEGVLIQSSLFILKPDNDLNNWNIAMKGGMGFILNLNRIEIGISGTKKFNLNYIINVEGPRSDGFGEEGDSFKLHDRTYILNLIVKYNFH